MKQLKTLFIASLAILLTACASTPNYEILKQEKIAHVSVASPTRLTYEPSQLSSSGSTAGLGLLGVAVAAGIDAANNSARNKRFIPILDILKADDLRAMFAKELTGLSGEVFAPVITTDTFDSVIPKSQMKDNSLNLSANYQLSPNHQTIAVIVNSQLKLGAEGKISRSYFSGNSSVDLGGTKVEVADVTQFWVDNPEELKKHLTLAMQDTVKKIAVYYNTDQTKKK